MDADHNLSILYCMFVHTCLTTAPTVPSLTTFPSWLNALMCPFTEPMQTQESEQEGEEKNGTSVEYVHKTLPLSYKTNTQKKLNDI